MVVVNDSVFVSIVMAAYNEEAHIAEAIESIKFQTYQNWELIIVDDCSIDNTVEIIKSYIKDDSRIRLIRNFENLGLAACLNRAIEDSKFDLIARADADDINLPERLRRQVIFLNSNPEVDVLGTGAWLLDFSRQRIRSVSLSLSHEELRCLPFLKTHFFHSSVVIRKHFFKKYGYYDSSYRRAQDKELWLRGLELGAVYANLHEPLIEYATNNYIRSWKSIFMSKKTLLSIGRKYKVKYYLFYVLIILVKQVLIKLRLWRSKALKY